VSIPIRTVFVILLAVTAVVVEFALPDDLLNDNFFPGILSLLPPLIAIAMALITREVIISLFCGVWIGAVLLQDLHPISGLARTLDTYLVNAMADESHAAIILFSLGFGGIIGLVSANGGMKGIVESISQYARTARSTQLATMAMGVMIFFDDYSNTLFVGNMMRPFTDRLRVSREKLSYLVDSTAAPVASLAIISTWSVFQMSLLNDPYEKFNVTESPYITFIRSVPYSFYCILAIVLMFQLLWRKRDYGPMLKAEERARNEGKVMADGARPLQNTELQTEAQKGMAATHWSNALVPIVAVVLITLFGLVITGIEGAEAKQMTLTVRNVVGNANSYASLMWGAFIAGLIGIVMTVVKRIMTLRDATEAWINGARAMLVAFMVLVLAWSLGNICEDVKTGEYLASVTESFPRELIPAVTFLVAALISFSTGTSWGTMSILIPVIVPVLLAGEGVNANNVVQGPIFLSAFAAVLSGAVFGDHCSPISDTTILSSMASGSDHIDHVRTQLPYALTGGFIAIIFGFVLVGYGIPWIVSITLAVAATAVVVQLLGKQLQVSG
tara:strand:- start:8925 stop:10598 length:1674 start_codon:yes stop_codon:yes gene_type:complete